MFAAVDAGDDFGRLLIVAPVLETLCEGVGDGPDLKHAVWGIVAASRHGQVPRRDRTGVVEGPDFDLLLLQVWQVVVASHHGQVPCHDRAQVVEGPDLRNTPS